MSKRLIYISISLITAALICVVSFQVAWYNNAHDLKKQLLERSVQDALRDVVTKVENREAADVITDRVKFFTSSSAETIALPDGNKVQSFVAEIEIPPSAPEPPAAAGDMGMVRSRQLPFAYASPHITAQKIRLDSLRKQASDLASKSRQVKSLVLKLPPAPPYMHSRTLNTITYTDSISRVILSNTHHMFADSLYIYDFPGFGTDSMFVSNTYQVNMPMRTDSFMHEINRGVFYHRNVARESKPQEAVKPAKKILVKQKLNDVLNKLVKEMELKDRSHESRVPDDTLRLYITQALADHGIRGQFLFEVKDGRDHGTKMDTSGGKQFCVALYPNDLSQEAAVLSLVIPDQDKRIFKSMTMHLAGSVMFTLIICCTFAYAIYVMMKQKRMAEIRNDFINNMTHELKTPIATISLAADTISNDHTLSDKEKVMYYTSVIKEENKRMNSQVEKVLQLALTDKSNFELTLVPCSPDEIVLAALNKFRMIIEAEERHVILDMGDSSETIMADCFHLEHAIANVIDNAIKYSPAGSTIRISAVYHPQVMELSIADEGRGMKKEVQKKVFDKFYREQHGNLHDVKGFGIGLSYVKNVIDAHKGKVDVRSVAGKGTTFIITLPKK